MTLSERIERAARRAGATTCARCGIAHNGAAWSPLVGWHDHAPVLPRTMTERAAAGDLPGKVL